MIVLLMKPMSCIRYPNNCFKLISITLLKYKMYIHPCHLLYTHRALCTIKYLYSHQNKTVGKLRMMVWMLQMMIPMMIASSQDGFIMMTPAATSHKIATESAVTKVSFTHSMLNMIDDILHNVPKKLPVSFPI
jgi:hypothetical protein